MLKKIFCLLLMVTTTLADTQVGRYLTVENKPTMAQINLLTQIVQVHFPAGVVTIGDAMQYLLRLSGYDLISPAQQTHALKITLRKTLPVIDRIFGPMPLKAGLTTLAGPAFNLVEDPLNRQVDFRLKPTFAKLYGAK